MSETEPGAGLALPEPAHVDLLAPIGMPSPGEWAALAAMADQLARSGLAPKALRGKPDDLMLILLTGRDLRLAPTQAMAKIHVIEGKPTLSAELMSALVNRQPGMRLWPDDGNNHERAICHAVRDGVKMEFRFTWGDAVRAKLVSKGTWQAYPQFMLWARAVSGLCRMAFADVLAGVSYSPEELGVDVDPESGDVISASATDYHPPGSAPLDRDEAARAAGWGSADEADEALAALKAQAEAADPTARRRTGAWAKRHTLSPHFRDGYDQIKAAAAWFAAHRQAEVEAGPAPFDTPNEEALSDEAAFAGYARHLRAAETPQEAPVPPTPQPAPDRAGDEAPAAHEPITAAQLRRVNIILGEHGYTGADRFPFLTAWAEREITSTKELTKAEAGRFIQEAAVAP